MNRINKLKKRLVILFLLVIALLIAGCSSNRSEKTKTDQTVVVAGWGGDPIINNYMNTTFKNYVKETTGLDMKWLPMNADEYLAKLMNEKEANAKGNIDVIWINGENFFYAKENDLLDGPFLEELPNTIKYLNVDDPSVNMDFGYPTNGFESPWGKSQFSFFYDSDKIKSPPKNTAELLVFLQENKGKFTYPEVTDFTGSAFIRTVLYDIIGYEQLSTMSTDKETIRKTIKPAIDYLNEIKPFLWRKGETYPKDIAALEKLYQDGEVWVTMDYNTMKGYRKVTAGEWTSSTKLFLWEKGTPFNTHFLAIPFNSRNSGNAQKLINATISVEMQAEKARLDGWGDTTVLDFDKLSSTEKEKFENQKPVDSQLENLLLSQEEIDSKGKPELPANLVTLIEEIWKEDVLLAK